MKEQISIKIGENTLMKGDIIAKNYEISRSNYLEMLVVLDILNNDIVDIDDDYINSLIQSLISKSSCNIKNEFKELNCKLPLDVKKEIVTFFYNANMIKDINYSCVKQANFYKNDKYLFYYAVHDMKNIDIDVYINTLDIKYNTIGHLNSPSSEYIYIGRKRYFNRNDQESTVFDVICDKLGVSKCDAIKIHYKELRKLIPILKSI